jgi:hypothetical protein
MSQVNVGIHLDIGPDVDPEVHGEILDGVNRLGRFVRDSSSRKKMQVYRDAEEEALKRSVFSNVPDKDYSRSDQRDLYRN